MRIRVVSIAVALVIVAVACGIPGSGNVARVPPNKIEALNATVPTTATTTTTIPPTTIEPTTTTIPAITTTTIVTEDATLYFIDNNGVLVSYPRALRQGATSSEILQALEEGPLPGNLGIGLRSAVPSRSAAPLKVTEDGSGVATVDLPANFFEIVTPEDQRLAIGQIVLTLTQIRGVGQVLFTLAGGPTTVPRGAGDQSQAGVPLPARDYAELLQAPTTTTTAVVESSTAPG